MLTAFVNVKIYQFQNRKMKFYGHPARFRRFPHKKHGTQKIHMNHLPLHAKQGAHHHGGLPVSFNYRPATMARLVNQNYAASGTEPAIHAVRLGR